MATSNPAAPRAQYGNPASPPQFLPAPPALRAAGAALCVAALLLSLAAAAFAARYSPSPLYAVAGLQALAASGAVLGLFWCRGHFLTGPVLAKLCAAGTVALPAALSFIAHRDHLGPLAMKWWALGEVAAAGGMAALALASAIERDRALRRDAIRGVLLALPALLLAIAFLFGPLDAALAKLPAVVRASAWGTLAIASAVMLCMSAHALSFAFAGASLAGRRPSGGA